MLPGVSHRRWSHGRTRRVSRVTQKYGVNFRSLRIVHLGAEPGELVCTELGCVESLGLGTWL